MLISTSSIVLVTGQSVNRSERAMPSMFGAPDVFAKLEKDPRTKDFAKDPSFVSTIKLLQANPNAIMQHLSDPRFSACINCFDYVYFQSRLWLVEIFA